MDLHHNIWLTSLLSLPSQDIILGLGMQLCFRVSANAWCLPTLSDRAFQSAAPKLWNSLPADIRNIQTLKTFKHAFKTYFFKTAFIDFYI